MGFLNICCGCHVLVIAILAVGLGFWLQAKSPLAQGVTGLVSICIDSTGPNPNCNYDMVLRSVRIFVDEVRLGSHWSDTAEATVEKHLGSGFDGLAGKTAIVTGSSAGLGEEIARVLLGQGCHVIFAVRTVGKGHKKLQQMQEANGGLGKGTVLHLDTSDLLSVRAFAKEFLDLDMRLHFIVANAGIVGPEKFETSKQGFELSFATNHLGHFLLGQLLEAKLMQSGTVEHPARMILLASEAGTVFGAFLTGTAADDMARQVPPTNQEVYDPNIAYTRTKFLNIAHAHQQQRRWGATATAIAMSVHPGIIPTELFTKSGNFGTDRVFFGPELWFIQKNISQGVATTLHCMLSQDVVAEARGGQTFYMNSKVYDRMAQLEAVNADVAEKAWILSEALL